MVNIDKIKTRAKDQGIKISFLCSQINKAHTFFSDAQRGKITITPDHVKVISEILGTSPAYLMDETDDPAPIKKESNGYGGLSEDKQSLIDLIVSIDDQQTIHAIKLLLDEIQGKK